MLGIFVQFLHLCLFLSLNATFGGKSLILGFVCRKQRELEEEEKEKRREEKLRKREQKLREREEKKNQKKVKKQQEEEQKKLHQKIAMEERKLLLAQRNLESIRLIAELLSRAKVRLRTFIRL